MLRRMMIAGSAGGGSEDPLFGYVRALCHFEAAPDATTWPDDVVAAGWSSAAAANITSSAARFGVTGLSCSGGGGRFSLSSPIGTSDYTAEFWYRPYSANGYRQIIDLRGGTSPLGASVFRKSGGILALQLASVEYGAIPLTIGSWQHICVERLAGNVTLYVNGSVRASAVDERAYTGTGWFCLGMTYNTGQLDVADYDEFRLTVGVARYGGSFTPPSAPFPSV